MDLNPRTESSAPVASDRLEESHDISLTTSMLLKVDITSPHDLDDLQVPPSPDLPYHSSSYSGHFHTALASPTSDGFLSPATALISCSTSLSPSASPTPLDIHDAIPPSPTLSYSSSVHFQTTLALRENRPDERLGTTSLDLLKPKSPREHSASIPSYISNVNSSLIIPPSPTLSHTSSVHFQTTLTLRENGPDECSGLTSLGLLEPGASSNLHNRRRSATTFVSATETDVDHSNRRSSLNLRHSKSNRTSVTHVGSLKSKSKSRAAGSVSSLQNDNKRKKKKRKDKVLRGNNAERRGLRRRCISIFGCYHLAGSTVSCTSLETTSTAGIPSSTILPDARVPRGSGKDEANKSLKKSIFNWSNDNVEIGSRIGKVVRGWMKHLNKKPRTADSLPAPRTAVTRDKTPGNEKMDESPGLSWPQQMVRRTPRDESKSIRTKPHSSLNKDLPPIPISSSPPNKSSRDSRTEVTEKDGALESEKWTHLPVNVIRDSDLANPSFFLDPCQEGTPIDGIQPISYLTNIAASEKQDDLELEDEIIVFPTAAGDEPGGHSIAAIPAVSVFDGVPESVAALACMKLKSILENKTRYRALLSCHDVTAQNILDILQMLLDYPLLDISSKNSFLIALLRLSKRSGLYPKCFTLKGVQRGEFPITAGAFGEIWKGRFRGQAVCLKMVKVYEKSHVERLLTAFSREAIVWRHVSHPNLLPFYGIYHLEDAYGRICLVSPWMENGNINLYLEQHPEANRLPLVSDIINGIAYLHSNNIIHGDLKGANILVTVKGRACVTDFGLSAVIDGDVLKWTSLESTGPKGGTVRWLARELVDPDLENTCATRESDMYAFSCVCYEVFTGRVPFHEATHEATVMFQVMRGDSPSRPCGEYSDWGLTDAIWGLMEECWSPVSLSRPTAQDVIRRFSFVGLEKSGHSGLSEGWGPLEPAHFRNAVQDCHASENTTSIEEFLCMLDTFSGE